MAAHFQAFALLVASLALPFWALRAGFAKTFVADVFAFVVGTSSLLHVGIWLATVVTSFELRGETLMFSRLGRRQRTATIPDVAVVTISETDSSATVSLRQGTTLYFPFEYLAGSRELIGLLQTDRSSAGVIEGCLNRAGVARTVVSQWLATCFLLAIAALGAICIAVSIRPRNLIDSAPVILALGIILLALSATGFYFAVLHYWIGCVHSFRWDGDCLTYRTVLSTTLRQRFGDAIEGVSARRPDSRRAEAGSWRRIRFRDGQQLKLHIGTLQNADALFATLKADDTRRSDTILPRSLPAIGAEHSLWSSIAPHLESDERVVWLGRPVYGKLRSEMSAEAIFGLIPAAMGGIAFAIGWKGFVDGNSSALFLAAIGALFAGIGGYMIAAPRRYRSLLRETVYAVTSQRALIVHGLNWGTHAAVQRSGNEMESYGRDQVQMFEIVGKRRDLVLGGEWRTGRKGRRYWVNSGFLAADDPRGAEIALRCLIANAAEVSVPASSGGI